jgi:hypothetical protein
MIFFLKTILPRGRVGPTPAPAAPPPTPATSVLALAARGLGSSSDGVRGVGLEGGR